MILCTSGVLFLTFSRHSLIISAFSSLNNRSVPPRKTCAPIQCPGTRARSPARLSICGDPELFPARYRKLLPLQLITFSGTRAPSAVALATYFCSARVRFLHGVLYITGSPQTFCDIKKTGKPDKVTPASSASQYVPTLALSKSGCGSKRFSLLSACFIRKLPVVLSSFYFVFCLRLSALSLTGPACLRIKISQINVKHLHPLHSRHKHCGYNRAAHT